MKTLLRRILPLSISFPKWNMHALQRKLFGAQSDPRIGRRFCRVEMRGCMGDVRWEEKWGHVIAIDVGRCERGLIYDGGQSQATREFQRKQGQDTWARVKYDDGTEDWEPVWWFFDTGTHLEYQT